MGKTLSIAAFAALALALEPATGVAIAADNPTIIMMGGPLWDPFFGAMKKGADDAAQDLKVDYQWVTGTDPNNFVADYARLTKQSASRKPAAMVIGNYFPDTMDPIIKEITAAGIPVVIQHDGETTWREDGAIGYVGYNAIGLGRSAAAEAIKAGHKNGMCINHVPGNKGVERMCEGYELGLKEAGGSSKVLSVQFSDANNTTLVIQAIKGALQADAKIDAMFTIGSVQAMASVEAADQLGRTEIANGSLGLSIGSLNALKSGKLLFITDLQPYLDGYYGLLAAHQYVKYGMYPLEAIMTGPQMITKDNVDRVLQINTESPGVRGAS